MSQAACVLGHDLAVVGTNARGRCRECAREGARARYAANPARQQAANRRYRAKDPERTREMSRVYDRKYRAKPGVNEREREYAAKYRADPLIHARNKVYAKRYRAELRQQIIDAYGGSCVCCGSTRERHLALDHVNGNGNQHRREVSSNNLTILRLVVQQGYPSDFQLLCHNCNFEKHVDGRCGCSDV